MPAALFGAEDHPSVLPDRTKSFPGDDDVVQHVNIQQAPGFQKFFRKTDILFAGSGVARGMVVHQDHRRRPHAYGNFNTSASRTDEWLSVPM